MASKLRIILLFLVIGFKYASGQVPAISYPVLQPFTTGKAIATIKPTNTGGAVPAEIYDFAGTFAGTVNARGSVNGTGTSASFYYPRSLAVDNNGNIYVADYNVVRKITPAGVVSTFAGTGTSGTKNGAGNVATFGEIEGLACDPSGNVYVSDGFNDVADKSDQLIRKISPTGVVSTFAGKAGVTGSSDGLGTATFNYPEGLTSDSNGNIYVADSQNQLIRKISPTGVVSTIAGTVGVKGSTNGPALSATFNYPYECAVDAQGNLFVADSENFLIRKISTNGTVSTFAGNGNNASTDGNGTAASFSFIGSITIDAIGNLYVTNNSSVNTVRQITPGGQVTTFAGGNSQDVSSEGNGTQSIDGIGSQAGFEYLGGIIKDLKGDLYVSDVGAYLIRKISTNGFSIVKALPDGLAFDATTGDISGTPTTFSSSVYPVIGYNTSGSDTTSISISIGGTLSFPAIASQTYGVADFSPAVSNSGTISYTSSNSSVATIVAGQIHVLTVGTSTITATNGSTTLSEPLTVTPAPLTLIADNKSKNYNTANPALTITYDGFVNNDKITSLTSLATISTVATTATTSGNYPILITGAVDSNYNIKFVAGILTILGGTTTIAAPIIKYTSPQNYNLNGAISPLSPSNTGGSVPANPYALVTTATNQSSTGTDSSLPNGIVEDAAGNLYVSHPMGYNIYKITPGGVISIFAGSGVQGSANGTGTAASFESPSGMTIDPSGNIYVADQQLNTIREITPQGVVSNFATGLSQPSDIAIDKNGNFYVAEPNDCIIEKITPAGVVSLFAGQPGVRGSNDGQAAKATFMSPSSLATDASGNVYVTDQNSIRKISPAGLVSTIAGTQTAGYADGIGSAASFSGVNGITVDAANTLYVDDQNNNLIRKITPDGTVTTNIGTIGSSGSTDGIGKSASLVYPIGIFVDNTGSVYFCDYQSVKKFTTTGYSIDKSLPSGLTFDYDIGTISGTPTSVSNAANYTIGGYNVSGGSEAIINLSVVLSKNDTLTALSISSGELSPAFSSAQINYTASVNNSISQITVTPVASNANATIKVNGTMVVSGSASTAIPLVVGSNVIATTVTAQDGTTSQTYTITITRPPSTNANLSNLTLSKGTLTPTFASATTAYTDEVTNGTASITLTPTTSDPNATVMVNGTAVTSGNPSGAITLSVGVNAIAIVVTAQDGATKQTYTVNVTRPSTNAKLAGLTISSGTLSPAFNASTTSYTASVPNSSSSITITPTVAVSGATVTVNGTAVTSGSPSAAIPLAVGTNTITIVVTAQDGVTTNTYTITATRAASSNASLANITVSKGTLSPAFAATTTSYTDIVTNGTASVTVTPAVADATATVTVNGTAVTSGKASAAIALSVGANTITTVVTAQDGTTKLTYTLNVIRPSTNAKLSALTLSSGTLTPAFNTNTANYTASAPYATSSVTLTPTVAVTGATITVNGTAVTSGSPSGAIALSVGGNTITTVVTAQDGVTTMTYTLTVTRQAISSNASLSNITLSKGLLSPAFAAATTSYTDMVTNSTAAVTITPTAADPTSTITVNGTAVISGKPSGAIALAVGSNTVTIITTAQNGTTTQTYTVNVIRPSTNAKLSAFVISSGTLTPAFNTNTTSYTASVTNATSSITVTPTAAVTGATVTINGTTVASGSVSGAIALAVGSNTVTTVVTAQDGVTTDTYTLTVTRTAADNNVYEPVSVETPADKPQIDDDVLIVHQGISPNGDGINDFLVIDGILAYPDNHLSIMNRSGQLIYESKGYDNATKVFDGHSNKTGQMQLPGTYFYELDYVVRGVAKQKTGYLVLKY